MDLAQSLHSGGGGTRPQATVGRRWVLRKRYGWYWVVGGGEVWERRAPWW